MAAGQRNAETPAAKPRAATRPLAPRRHQFMCATSQSPATNSRDVTDCVGGAGQHFLPLVPSSPPAIPTETALLLPPAPGGCQTATRPRLVRLESQTRKRVGLLVCLGTRESQPAQHQQAATRRTGTRLVHLTSTPQPAGGTSEEGRRCAAATGTAGRSGGSWACPSRCSPSSSPSSAPSSGSSGACVPWPRSLGSFFIFLLPFSSLVWIDRRRH